MIVNWLHSNIALIPSTLQFASHLLIHTHSYTHGNRPPWKFGSVSHSETHRQEDEVSRVSLRTLSTCWVTAAPHFFGAQITFFLSTDKTMNHRLIITVKHPVWILQTFCQSTGTWNKQSTFEKHYFNAFCAGQGKYTAGPLSMVQKAIQTEMHKLLFYVLVWQSKPRIQVREHSRVKSPRGISEPGL